MYCDPVGQPAMSTKTDTAGSDLPHKPQTGEQETNAGIHLVLENPNQYPPVFVQSVVQVIINYLEGNHNAVASFQTESSSIEQCEWSNAMGFGFRQEVTHSGYSEITVSQTAETEQQMIDILTADDYEDGLLTVSTGCQMV
jgi:hypothetical protein